MRGDLNFCFNSKLEGKSGKPTLKEKSFVKMIELIGSFELCHIWRIRNPTQKPFTFVKVTFQDTNGEGLIIFLYLIRYKNQQKTLIYLHLFQLIILLNLLF